MAEYSIAYLLLFTGLVFASRGASDAVDRVVTNIRAFLRDKCPSSGRIRLNGNGDGNGPKKRPFPRWGLIPVAILAIAGLVVEILFVVAVARDRSGSELSFWFTQVVYFLIYPILLFFAISYPVHLFVTATVSVLPTRPSFALKCARILTNPGVGVQQVSLILALLPLVASLDRWGCYNNYYFHRYRFYTSEVISVIQPVLAAVIFIYATIVRQVFGDSEDKPETEYVSVARTEEGRVPLPRVEKDESILEGSDVDALEVVEPVTPPPASPKASTSYPM